jgi:hypothetical protein
VVVDARARAIHEDVPGSETERGETARTDSSERGRPVAGRSPAPGLPDGRPRSLAIPRKSRDPMLGRGGRNSSLTHPQNYSNSKPHMEES